MGEIHDSAICHDQIDDDRRTAQFRMSRRGGAGCREPSSTRNISRQIENPMIIYVREHRFAWH